MPKPGDKEGTKVWHRCDRCKKTRLITPNHSRYAPSSVKEQFVKQCNDCRKRHLAQWILGPPAEKTRGM